MPIEDVNFAYMKNIIFLQSYHTMLPAGAGGQGLALQNWICCEAQRHLIIASESFAYDFAAVGDGNKGARLISADKVFKLNSLLSF